MDERDERAVRAGTRLGVDETHAARGQVRQRRAQVLDAQRDVVEPGSARLDERRNRRVGRGGLEQLERGRAGVEHVRADPLRGHVLGRFDLEPERVAIERQRLVEALDRDADVIEHRFHTAPRRSTRRWPPLASRAPVPPRTGRCAVRRRRRPPLERARRQRLLQAGQQHVAHELSQRARRQRSRRRAAPGRRLAARETARARPTAPSTPRPVVASVLSTGGTQSPAAAGCSDSAASTDCTRWSIPSRSALLTTKMSAISMMPGLDRLHVVAGARHQHDDRDVGGPRRCPPRPARRRRSRSGRRRCPAASSTSAASLVARASPPRWPRVAMLRMNTPASAGMRAHAHAIAEDGAAAERAASGSTARTPTVQPGAADLGDQPIDQRALAAARARR